MNVSINRIIKDIKKYSEIGRDDSGGVSRTVFSSSDFEARNLFISELKEMGLEVFIDGAANIWGRYPGNQRKNGSIVIGSHLDSVLNGGKYDGVLGVLVAKEIVQTFIDKGMILNHNIEVVSFSGEEANDFNLSTMGSRIFTGKLVENDVVNIVNSSGMKLTNAFLKGRGGTHLFSLMEEERTQKKVFLELHIEQGKRLENERISLGIVDKIVGIHRDIVFVEGESNHSGTTMMEDRFDALNTAAEMLLAVEDVVKSLKSNAVATVGKFNVSPNATNIIPGKVDFILEIRSSSSSEITEILRDIKMKWEEIRNRRSINIEIKNILDQKEVNLDNDVVRILRETAKQLKIPTVQFASMAGHDASHLASIAKTAMIFVRSPNGKSHCPKEYSSPKDIEKASNLMLNAILNIDNKFENI